MGRFTYTYYGEENSFEIDSLLVYISSGGWNGDDGNGVYFNLFANPYYPTGEGFQLEVMVPQLDGEVLAFWFDMYSAPQQESSITSPAPSCNDFNVVVGPPAETVLSYVVAPDGWQCAPADTQVPLLKRSDM
jgi:hypothetical protein